MLRLLKLIISATIISFALSSSVKIQSNRETWHDALVRCNQENSSLANITVIEQDYFCNKTYQSNVKKTYWIGHFYELLNRISIKGCTDNMSYPTIDNVYKSLHDCFEICSGMMKAEGYFAHKAGYDPNCVCGLNREHNQIYGIEKPDSFHCRANFAFWWIYKVHEYDINTSNETCRQLRCNESESIDSVMWKINCGQNTMENYHFLRSPIPQDQLPYICQRNEPNTTTSTENFRFAIKASVKQDRLEKFINMCEAITCFSFNSYRTFLQNCELKLSGFLCFNESNVSHESTSSTTNIFSRTFSTISYHLNTPENEKKGNANYGTNNSNITPQTTFQPSILPPHSSPGHVENSQVGITSPKRSSTKVILKTEGLPTIPSRNNSSLHTSVYTTDLDKMNVAESTTQTSKVIPNGHHGNSKTGLIVGSAVAIVVILVAAVLLVSCRLRHRGPCRKKKFVDDIQINELNDSNYQDDNSIKPTCKVHNTMYDVHTLNGDNTTFGLLDVSLDNSNNIRNNEYAVVVKTKQLGTDVLKQDCDTNGRNSNDLLENEDDRNNHERPSSCYSSSNILDNEYAVVVKNDQSSNQVLDQNCGMKAENPNDLTECEYDRLNHVRPRSGVDSRNIYDSALGFREEYDATYNMTDYRGSDKRDDAVYNHA